MHPARSPRPSGGEPFLRRADVEHALGGAEGLEALAGDLVLALPLADLPESDFFSPLTD